MANGDGGVPAGYHEVPAPGQGGPPPGYHEVGAPTQMGGASGSYQLQPKQGAVESFFNSAMPVAREGALGFASGLGIPESQTPVRDIVKGATAQPSMASLLDPTAGGLQGAASFAKGLYSAGKDLYDSFKQKDPSLAAHGIGELAGQALQLKGLKGAPEGAARDVNAMSLLGSGDPMGLGNALKTRALARATEAASDLQKFFKKGEAVQTSSVEDSVRSIQIADQMKARASGKRGVIDTTNAQAALDQALNTVGIQAGSASSKAIGLMEGSIRTDATFEEAKQLRTVLGTLGRATKNPADRMVIGAARQQLTEAMEARATSEDVNQTKAWNSYNDIWRKLETAKDTWQQDLYDANSAYGVHKLLTGEHWGKIQQAAKELQSEFGVKNKDFYSNVEKLKKNVAWVPLDKQGTNFRGILNTIGKHPITGLTAYAAAQALGLPFLARFIGIMGAGKLNDVLSQLGEPRASMPSEYGKMPEGGASPQQPPSALTEPPHPIPPQHDYMNGAPPQSPEIANAVQSIKQERAAAVSTNKGLEIPNAPTSGMPPEVGTAKPIERRVSEAPYTGAERRAKLNPLPPPEGEELARQIRQARASIHTPEAGILAKQIVAARQGSLGKATPLSDPSPALAEEVRTAKQATFAAHQRAKGKR